MKSYNEIEEAFYAWLREIKRAYNRLKRSEDSYYFWREKWMSVGGVNYDIERTQGCGSIDPHMMALDKMLEAEKSMVNQNMKMAEVGKLIVKLSKKQKSFFEEVLLKGSGITEYCQKYKVTNSRGYELKRLIVLKWNKILF